MNQSTRAAFLTAVRAKIEEAEQKFNVNFDDVKVELNIRGNRIAGQACSSGYTRRSLKFKPARLRFNPNAITEHFDEMINITVPHEIAHMVCMKRRELGHNHDHGWQRVDLALGGNGETRHSMEFGGAIKRKVYVYQTTTGQKITLSSIRHKKVQQGASYTLRSDRSKILASGYIGTK